MSYCIDIMIWTFLHKAVTASISSIREIITLTGIKSITAIMKSLLRCVWSDMWHVCLNKSWQGYSIASYFGKSISSISARIHILCTEQTVKRLTVTKWHTQVGQYRKVRMASYWVNSGTSVSVKLYVANAAVNWINVEALTPIQQVKKLTTSK